MLWMYVWQSLPLEGGPLLPSGDLWPLLQPVRTVPGHARVRSAPSALPLRVPFAVCQLFLGKACKYVVRPLCDICLEKCGPK